MSEVPKPTLVLDDSLEELTGPKKAVIFMIRVYYSKKDLD